MCIKKVFNVFIMFEIMLIVKFVGRLIELSYILTTGTNKLKIRTYYISTIIIKESLFYPVNLHSFIINKSFKNVVYRKQYTPSISGEKKEKQCPNTLSYETLNVTYVNHDYTRFRGKCSGMSFTKNILLLKLLKFVTLNLLAHCQRGSSSILQCSEEVM